MNSIRNLNNLGAKLLMRHGHINKEIKDLLRGSLCILHLLVDKGSVADLSCLDGACSQHPHVKKALQLAKAEQNRPSTTFAAQDLNDRSYLFVYLQPIVIELTSFGEPCGPSILAPVVLYNMALYENLVYLQGPGKISHLKRAITLYEMVLNILPDEHVSIVEHLRTVLLNNLGAIKYEQRDYNGAALYFSQLQDHIAEISDITQEYLQAIILNLGLILSVQPFLVAVAA